MARMMRSNFHRQPSRLSGHGDCAICKPDDWKGRAAEKAEWKLDWREFEPLPTVQEAYESMMEVLRRVDEENRPWWPHKVSVEQDPDDENTIRLRYTPDWDWGDDSIF